MQKVDKINIKCLINFRTRGINLYDPFRKGFSDDLNINYGSTEIRVLLFLNGLA